MGNKLIVSKNTKIKDEIKKDIIRFYNIDEQNIEIEKMTDNMGKIIDSHGNLEKVICIIPYLESRTGFLSQQLIPILYNFILQNLEKNNLDLFEKNNIVIHNYNPNITSFMEINILCAYILGINTIDKENEEKIRNYIADNSNIDLETFDEIIRASSSQNENSFWKIENKTLILKEPKSSKSITDSLTNEPYYFCIKAYPAIILALKEGYDINFDNLLKPLYVKNKTLNLLLRYILKIKFKEILLNNSEILQVKKNPVNNLPYQKIVYGAPGTGKSYSLNQEVEKYFGNNIKRVTFYDGYTYGQFVGMYKPTVDEKNGIGYSYVPGPFMQQLVQSLKNSEDNFCLVVEEINRAKADKVFGNIFQLLDRDSSGKSRYPVSVSEEQLEFLKIELKEQEEILEEIKEKGLYIPDNLYIWATMNSADEGVQPLDTAFKRRWKFEYISLNKNEEKFEKQRGNIKLIIGKNTTSNLEWNEFRKTVNGKLQEYNITEDRLIAPFFISPDDFTIQISEDTYALDKNIFVEKVLMYIFDDLLRHYPKIRNEIFKDDVKTFSKIYEALSDGEYELDNYYKKLNAILSESLFPELFKEEKNVSEK